MVDRVRPMAAFLASVGSRMIASRVHPADRRVTIA
jgi:hypothetical protein